MENLNTNKGLKDTYYCIYWRHYIVLTYFIHRGPTEYPDVLDLLTKGCGLEAIQSGGEGRGNQMSTRRDLISVGGKASVKLAYTYIVLNLRWFAWEDDIVSPWQRSMIGRYRLPRTSSHDSCILFAWQYKELASTKARNRCFSERTHNEISYIKRWNTMDIGSTVLKLMAVERCSTTPPPSMVWYSFSCHNLNSVDPVSNFLWFSESLEKKSSNGVIKNHIWEIKVFSDLAIPWIIAHGPRPKNDKLGPQQNFGLKHIIGKVSF